MALASSEGWLFLLRWLHFFAGVIWIGLLYYFNFVQTPFFAETEAPVRGGHSSSSFLALSGGSATVRSSPSSRALIFLRPTGSGRGLRHLVGCAILRAACSAR